MEKGIQILELAIVLPLLILLTVKGVDYGISCLNQKLDRDSVEQALIEFRFLFENTDNIEQTEIRSTEILNTLTKKLQLEDLKLSLTLGHLRSDNSIEISYLKELGSSKLSFENENQAKTALFKNEMLGAKTDQEFIGVIFRGEERGLNYDGGRIILDGIALPINRIHLEN